MVDSLKVLIRKFIATLSASRRVHKRQNLVKKHILLVQDSHPLTVDLLASAEYGGIFSLSRAYPCYQMFLWLQWKILVQKKLTIDRDP